MLLNSKRGAVSSFIHDIYNSVFLFHPQNVIEMDILYINPFRQIICDDEKVILCEILQYMVHFTLSDRRMPIFVSGERCECSCGKIDAIQALSVFLCCVCVWQNETFLYQWSTAAPTTIWCQTTQTHTQKTHRQACQMTEHINSVTHLMTNTTLTHRYT